MGEVGQQSFHAISQEELRSFAAAKYLSPLLLKWVNYFPITQDCAAENLKNWHGMKER